MTVVYIAGPYRGESANDIHNNIEAARSLAVQYWQRGHAVLCPHMNSAFMDGAVSDQAFLDGGLELMRRCDVVALVPGWERSAGTRKEVEEALFLGKKVWCPMRDSRSGEIIGQEVEYKPEG